MKSRLLCLVLLVLTGSFLLAQSSSSPAAPSQPAAAPSSAPTTLRWAEGDKNSELVTQQGVRIEIIHGPGVDIAVSLLDLQEFATRAWVQVLNKGNADLPIDPAQASLQILKPKAKTLPSENAGTVASHIQEAADVQAEDRTSSGCAIMKNAGCSQNSSGVASSKEVEQRADAMIGNVKSTALQAQTIKPGDQVQGAIFFAYERKRQESLLRVPVGNLIFEFPFLVEKK